MFRLFVMLFQKLFSACKVVRSVYSYGLHIGYTHPYAVTVLQPAQLFEALGKLKGRLWQLCNLL